MAYDAFISYSHSADGRLAPGVQTGLQRLARPWYRMRALRVFRDETGLSVNPHLWGSIESALDESEYFVLLASPEAAASPWVAREIEHWMATKPVERILPVLTDGDVVWDEAAGAYDAERSTALPPILATAFVAEPRHLDFRFARTEEQLDLRHAEFRAAIAALAAPMHGISRDELEGQDVAQHRRTLRIAWGAAALLLLVTIAALVSASFAVRYAADARASERRALQQQTRARRNAREATSQRTLALANARVARTAQGEAESNASLAADNAAQAETERSRAEQNAQESARNAAEAEANGQEAEAQTIAAQQNAARASANALEAQTNATRAAENAQAAARSAADAQGAADVAAAQRDLAQRNAETAREQRAAAVASATVARSRQLAAGALNVLATAPDRSLAMSVQANRFDANVQAQDSVMRTLQRQPGALRSYVRVDPDLGRVTEIVPSPDRRVLLMIGSTGHLALRDLSTGRALASPNAVVTGLGRGVWFSEDGSRLVIATSDSVVVWDVASGRTAATLDLPSGGVQAATLSADHQLVAVVAQNGVHLLPVPPAAAPTPGVSIPLPAGFEPFRLALSADHSMLAVSGVTGNETQTQVLVFATGSAAQLAALPADTGPCTCIDQHGSVELRFDVGSGPGTLTSVALGGHDFALIGWEVGTWTRTREVPAPAEVRDGTELVLGVNAEHTEIVTSSRDDALARVRDLATGGLVGVGAPAHLQFCTTCGGAVGDQGAVAFGPSDTIVTLGTDRLLRWFDTGPAPDRLAHSVPTGIGFFNQTTISADGSVAAVLGIDGRVTAYATDDGHRISTMDPGSIASSGVLAMSPDGSRLVLQASFYDRVAYTSRVELSAWDVGTGQRLWLHPSDDLSIGAIAVDPSGRLVATTATPSTVSADSLPTFELLDLATGDRIAAVPIPPFYESFAFSPDGRYVAMSGSYPGEPPLLYGVTEHRIVRALTDPRLADATSLRFSDDGRIAIATTASNGVLVLDATTFAVTGDLEVGDALEVAVADDGSLIAVAALGGHAVQLYDARTGDTFGDPVGPVLDAPPGSTVGAAGRDLVLNRSRGTLTMFSQARLIRVDLDPASWISQACELAGRNLTRAEWNALFDGDVRYERSCPALPSGE